MPTPVDPYSLGDSCAEPPSLPLLHGIDQYNRGEYFECHETLELLWRAEPRPVRRLYQGILLVGVSLYKVYTQRNYDGAIALIERGMAYLQGFPPVCQGIDLARFSAQARRTRDELLRLGPTDFHELDRKFVPVLAHSKDMQAES